MVVRYVVQYSCTSYYHGVRADLVRGLGLRHELRADADRVAEVAEEKDDHDNPHTPRDQHHFCNGDHKRYTTNVNMMAMRFKVLGLAYARVEELAQLRVLPDAAGGQLLYWHNAF